MTTPSSANLYLGAGDVMFDRFDANGLPTGLRHLGNVSALDLTTTVTTLEKHTDMSGVRGIYKQVITGTVSEIAATLDEWDPDNVALALLGVKSSLLQTTSTATAKDIAGAAALVADLWYDLGGINPTVTSVTQASTALNTGAYVIDADAGFIKFLSSYTGANPFVPGPATWTGTFPAIVSPGKTKIDALSVGAILGHLHYKSAIDQASGPRIMLDVWSLNIHPDGALKLIDTAFGAITLKGQAMQDTTRPLGQQYFRAVYL